MERYEGRDDRVRCSMTVRSAILAIITVSMIYWWAATFYQSKLLSDMIDGALVAVAIAVAWKYSSWAFLNLRRTADQKFMIRLGIALVWAAMAIRGMSRFYYRNIAETVTDAGIAITTTVDSRMRSYFILLAIIGGSLHILGIDMDLGRPRPSQILTTGAAVMIGVMAVLAHHMIGHAVDQHWH